MYVKRPRTQFGWIDFKTRKRDPPFGYCGIDKREARAGLHLPLIKRLEMLKPSFFGCELMEPVPQRAPVHFVNKQKTKNEQENIMLREAEALDFLRLQEEVQSRPTEAIAIYENGMSKPVFIHSHEGGDVFVVEGEDYEFYEAEHVPGLVFSHYETRHDLRTPVEQEPPPGMSSEEALEIAGRLNSAELAERLKTDRDFRKAIDALPQRN